MTEDIFSMIQNVSDSGTNGSRFTSEDIYVEDLPLRLLKALLILIVIMAATVGNAICITVVLKTELLRVPAGNFMISLAIADFCLGMFVAPISFTACILGEWVFPDIGKLLRLFCCLQFSWFSGKSKLLRNFRVSNFPGFKKKSKSLRLGYYSPRVGHVRKSVRAMIKILDAKELLFTNGKSRSQVRKGNGQNNEYARVSHVRK